jgi:hypothetical protein
MIKADPETANKFQKYMAKKIQSVHAEAEKEEKSENKAEDILKEL